MKAPHDHIGCSAWDPCLEGEPSTCPREANRLLIDQADRQRWGRLVTRESDGGPRHTLDGEDIHCGSTLILQSVENREFPDDPGSTYQFPLDQGRRVRYEASFSKGRIDAFLHVTLDGHEFVSQVEPWMGFRRP